MSELERIALLAEELAKKHGTRNPFEIAQGEGIEIMACPDFKSLKGMYKIILGKRFVFLNGNLTRREASVVLAHELGHDALHREMAENSIVQDAFILDMTLKPEYEANLFAANLLYPTAPLRERLRAGESTGEIAKKWKANEALLELKIRTMEKLHQI